MQGVHLRKYGVEATIDFEVYEVDGVDLRVDWVPAQADCEIMKDGGASTQCINTATDEGSTYSIVLTATEMQFARGVLKVVDAATKVFLDKVVVIETYGNASAQHAFDLDTASVAQSADNNTILAHGTYGSSALQVLIAALQTDLDNGTDGLGALKALLDAIPTTAMRGTDNAALASVVGALNNVAADGDPTNADTLVQYLKQLINILVGTAGIVAFPAEQAPANAISLAEVIRAIHADVTGLNGSAMVGTNGANTTVPDAAGTAPTAAEIKTAMEAEGASDLDAIADAVVHGTYGLSALQVLIAALQTDLDNGTDGLGALKTLLDAIPTTTEFELRTLLTADYTVVGDLITAAAIADAVWDELLTGASHNLATSAGRRLRQLTDNAVREETAQGGTINTITLDVGASAVDNYYDPGLVLIYEGTGAGQSRRIIDYKGETKVITVNQDWRVNPAVDSVFIVFADAGLEVDNEGAAQGGDADSITLNSQAVAVNDTYVGQLVVTCSSTGKGQARIITGYVGATRVATVHKPWVTNPVAGTGYFVIQHGAADLVTIDGIRQSALDAKDFVDEGYDPTTNKIEGCKVNDDMVGTASAALASVCTEARLARLNANVDSRSSHNAAAVKTAVEAAGSHLALIKAVTDILNGLIEDVGGKRYTEKALEEAPSGTDGDASAANQNTIIAHLTDVKGGTFDGNTDSLEKIRDRGDDAWITGGSPAGAGAITWVYTLTETATGDPIGDADVWVSTDEAGSNVVASGKTDQSGQVTFYLDAGTVYVWRQKSGWNFTNPDTEVVS